MFDECACDNYRLELEEVGRILGPVLNHRGKVYIDDIEDLATQAAEKIRSLTKDQKRLEKFMRQTIYDVVKVGDKWGVFNWETELMLKTFDSYRAAIDGIPEEED